MTQAPAPHLRFAGVVTTVPPLFGGVPGGFCLAVLPVELVAMPAEPGFVVPPTTDAGAVEPPIIGPGFAAPPIAFCLAFVAPPTALWAEEGGEELIAKAPKSAPSRKAVTIALMDITFVSCRRVDIGAACIDAWPVMPAVGSLYPKLWKCECTTGRALETALFVASKPSARQGKESGQIRGFL